MCQHCVDEGRLTQATENKIDSFLKVWPNAAYGPAHVVLDDNNIGDHTINWCLSLIVAVQTGVVKDGEDLEMLVGLNWYADHPADELEATRVILTELLSIPEDVR